eukprot:XP_001702887.1 predicted protein [Chlamydomonas reinhardtii]
MAEVQRRANIKATDSINHQLVALGLRAPLHTVLGCLSFNRRGPRWSGRATQTFGTSHM